MLIGRKAAAKDRHDLTIKVTIELVAACQKGQAAAGNPVVDLMNKLKADAEVALLRERDRLNSLSSDVQTLCNKLRTELASGNTARLLCRMSSSHVALDLLTKQWALPRIRFSKQTAKAVEKTASLPIAQALPAPVGGGRAGPVLACSANDESACPADAAERSHGDEVRCLDDGAGGTGNGKEMVGEADLQGDHMPLKRSADTAGGDTGEADEKSHMKRPKMDGDLLRLPEGNESSSGSGSSADTTSSLKQIPACSTSILLRADCISKFQGADKDMLAKFVLSAQLEGRLPVVTIGGPRVGLNMPCDVAFDEHGSLLIADCLNDRIEVFDLAPGEKE